MCMEKINLLFQSMDMILMYGYMESDNIEIECHNKEPLF